MFSHDDRYVMIYNGEVYNFQEIRDEKLKGCSFNSSGDTEVMLELFAKYGPESFRWLNGMFAFVIWDKQDKKLYPCQGCHLGIKPLYYYLKDDRFVFASELKVIKQAIPDLEINYRCYSFLPAHRIHPSSAYDL